MIAVLPMISQVAVSTLSSTKAKPQGEHSITPSESNPSAVVTLSAEAIQRSSADAATIRYGYTSSGAYLGSPTEFFNSQKAHYQQLGYEVNEDWMAYFKNEIMHPNPDGGVIAAPPLRAGENGIKFTDVLTATDQAILQKVSPFSEGGSGPRQINGLAVVIALERAQGNLQGEIDAHYASDLKNRLLSAHSDAIPLHTLDKLIAALSVDVHAARQA